MGALGSVRSIIDEIIRKMFMSAKALVTVSLLTFYRGSKY